MTQIETIIKHVDDQMTRIFDPMRKDVDEIKVKLPPMETRQALIDSANAAIHKRLDQIEAKMDRSYWFSLTTLVGMVVTVIVAILLRF